MTKPLLTTFVGGLAGPWAVDRIDTIAGRGLPYVPHLAVVEGGAPRLPSHPVWALRGVVDHERYATRVELEDLARRQAPLGRPTASRAALIPITKSQAWWHLGQDERRAIFEETSHHIAIGTEYLPAVARRLHHSRDLGEPFDFLTWFEFAPEHEAAFEALVSRLRAAEEWSYVVREVDIRLKRSMESASDYSGKGSAST